MPGNQHEINAQQAAEQPTAKLRKLYPAYVSVDRGTHTLRLFHPFLRVLVEAKALDKSIAVSVADETPDLAKGGAQRPTWWDEWVREAPTPATTPPIVSERVVGSESQSAKTAATNPSGTRFRASALARRARSCVVLEPSSFQPPSRS